MPNLASSGLPNRASYDTSNPAVVVDRVTGLTWERVVGPDSYGQRWAIDYCVGLRLAGHSDWRLPSMIELASISDTSQFDPAADPVAFANTPSEPFWSSQTDVTNTGLGWYLIFKSGGTFIGNDVARLARARCVRGPSSCAELDASAYSVAGDLVHDRHTGLTWQRQVDHDDYAWQDANAHCASLGSNGGGWRLPSLRELLTLVDVTHYEPAIDASAFPDTPSEFFWSSSPSRAPPAGTAWGVNFTRGASAAGLMGNRAHVRCAR
jgi:hypothetical protein